MNFLRLTAFELNCTGEKDILKRSLSELILGYFITLPNSNYSRMNIEIRAVLHNACA